MRRPIVDFWNKPCAAAPWLSYRYRGTFGWVMIGAMTDEEALREAKRSVDAPPRIEHLERWNGSAYVPANDGLYNSMLLAGLVTAYRETVARCGPSSMQARLWRKVIRDYLSTGIL